MNNYPIIIFFNINMSNRSIDNINNNIFLNDNIIEISDNCKISIDYLSI